MAYTIDPAVHERLLTMLDAVGSICGQLNIPYYLCYGSALGAIREQGIIPWDEDIDLVMWRKDYERFVKQAPSLLPQGLVLQDYRLSPHYPFQFCKVTDPATTLIYKQFRRVDMVHGISIDICPLDMAPDDEKGQRKQHGAFLKLNRILANEVSPSWKVKLLLTVVPKARAVRHYEKKLQRWNGKATGTVYCNIGDNWKERFMPASFYGTPRFVPFADRTAPVPEKAEEYLTWCFGDYMTPPPEQDREGQPHLAIDVNKSYLEYLK